MKKLLIFALYIGLLGTVNAGQVEISLNGINPLNINVAGVSSQQEAGGISVYVYFRNDGTTELGTTDNVTAAPLETGFGWGTGLLTKTIETGSWNKGGYTFTRRLLYDNTSVFSHGDDFWPTAGLNAITLNFNIVGTGQAYVEANGSDALPDFSGTAAHTVSYSNQEVTLPVELATFEAELAQNAVLLKWATASEKDNQGFNLYRSLQENGTYEKLNGSLIPGSGTTTNTNEYEFRDDRIESNKYYYYRLEDVDINGQAKQHGPINIFIDPALMAPTEYSLDQNYPNPFNPGTTISYGLPEDTQVRLQVFNMKGQVVATLVDAFQPAGRYDLRWDASTALNGSSLPTGIYFYKLETSQYTQIKKMIYTK